MSAASPARGPVWRLFSRVTSSGALIPEIDGLRFVAVFWVLGFHINGEYIKVMGAHFPGQIPGSSFRRVVETWDFGVQLFFVVSGFILSLPFVRHHWNRAPRPRLAQYYLRRVTRIEPPYIINLILCSALILLVKGPPLRELLPHLLASLLYVHNLVFHSLSSINFVTWSLEIEAQFYLAAPWLALIFAAGLPHRYGWLTGVVAASAAAAWWLNAVFPLAHLTLPGQLPYFLAGFLLAGWYSQNESSLAEKSPGWDVAGLAAWAAIQVLLLQKGLASAVLLPLLVAFAYACVFKGRLLRLILTRPLLTTIGGMCYTVYLYHPFLKSALKHLLFPLRLTGSYWINATIQILLLGGVIVLASSLLFLAFEKPFMHRDWPAAFRGFCRRAAWRRPVVAATK
jgi:peptidoglycan/LPS O-acetylase OafA/YrhL